MAKEKLRQLQRQLNQSLRPSGWLDSALAQSGDGCALGREAAAPV
jgi:hypothetical protein